MLTSCRIKIPAVKGLNEYISRFPGLVSHSKTYRSVDLYSSKRVIVVGNSASGHDITTQLVESGKPKLPVYQSRRSRSRWDGTNPPTGIEWKPIIKEYNSKTGEVIFADGTRLKDIDAIIYCIGYKPSIPFWNSNANGRPLYDYTEGHLLGNYQHTFSHIFPRSLKIISFLRTLTFQSFKYQAIALARQFTSRNAKPLPPLAEQELWEQRRAEMVKRENRKFHDIPWDSSETMDWLRFLFDMSGLPILEGLGRCPLVLGKETRWAIKHVRKYPEPGGDDGTADAEEEGWIVVERPHRKDSLHFI